MNTSSSIVLWSLLLTACVSYDSLDDSADSCWVPPMYRGFDIGLIQPTWESEAQMLEQLPLPDRKAVICWYGYVDGRIEARVNQTESGYFSHTFVRRAGSWVLVDSHEEIIVH